MASTRFQDITGWIENGMWSYSSAYPGATIGECPHPPELPDDYAVYCQRFELGGQSGTYIETKAHVDPTAPPVSAFPVEQFVMEAVILRVAQKAANEPITREELENTRVAIPADGAIIVATGWDRHWREPTRFVEGSPYLTHEAGLWLIEHRPRCLAADFPRFDYVPRPCFPWAELWVQVPFVLAPVVNVYDSTLVQARLFAFPLKIRGAMGTPVRAVLEVSDGAQTEVGDA